MSVRYGVRKPKYLLLKSRDEIALAFKAENPTCNFKVSAIKREFPSNAVTPTTRDQERNSCPVHANARRIIKCINKLFLSNNIESLPHSTRDLCFSVMCHQVDVSASEPTSWKKECVLGTCSSCPEFQTQCTESLLGKEVKFSLWESRKVTIDKSSSSEKYVFALYPYIVSLKEAILKLDSMLLGLKTHIFTAHCQWSAHDNHRNNMSPSSIITIEDYQMNMEVVYNEAPTSLAYSSNKRSVAMYPMCVEFIREDGCLGKGGIVMKKKRKLGLMTLCGVC